MINGSGTTVLAGTCPSWCQRGDGHEFDSRDHQLGTVVRIHARDFGEYVSICADEHAFSEAGPAWKLEEPMVEVLVDGPLGLADAAALADQLTKAVDGLRSLQ